MTSTLPEHLFENLGDIRDKYKDNPSLQNFALSRTYPRKFSTNALVNAPSYEEDTDFKFNTNFDAAVVVIRHLYSMVNGSDLRNEQMDKEEKSHPILRFIWADFEDTSDASITAQAVIRYEMQALDDPDGRLTVFALLERPAMWNGLWVRKAFQLYHSNALGRPQGTDEWNVMEHHPSITQKSLVKWNGAQPLGDHISSLFLQRVHKDTGARLLLMFNDPAIIRVRYQHTARDQTPATYEHLRQIYVNPHRLKNEKQNGCSVLVKATPDERIPYTLIGKRSFPEYVLWLTIKYEGKRSLRIYNGDP
ncbi:hypothetical protein F5Y10DRAFT_293137 [Nemania abortiva]|nr:hypothetical protein F5Y10DRAFT_293137 [Nemania abortiva]